MTIFTPDDSEVSEIVLPDGSQASEVVAPDGSVVWTAAPDIPDSAINRWQGDEGSGTTVSDTIGAKDLSFNAVNWVSDPSLSGGFGYETDGSDDLGTVGYDVAQYSTVYVPTTIITTDSGVRSYGWYFNANFSQFWGEIESDGTFTTSVGDGSNTVTATSTTAINDGNKHRVGIAVDENNEIGVAVDGTIESTTSFGTLDNPENTFAVGGTTGGERVAATWDNGILYNDWSSQLVSDDYSVQPWS